MGFLKNLFGGAGGGDSLRRSSLGNSPSLNDLSMGTAADAESEFMPADLPDTKSQAGQEQPAPLQRPSAKAEVWQSVFNPGRNYNMKKLDKDYFDNVDDRARAPTVWQQVIRAETLKKLSFTDFDKDSDGYISADDLRSKLGPQADVQRLIADADKNGDGKVDYYEFCEMLKHNSP